MTEGHNAMTKIVRTPTKATGGVTDAELAAIKNHSELWISRAMRTTPVNVAEITSDIENLYAVAGLKTPRVVVVPSPLVMAFAYGASAAIWHNRNATDNAVYNAVDKATETAILNATYNATRNAAANAAANAVANATRNATLNATANAVANAAANAVANAAANAVANAVDNATYNAVYNAVYNATRNAAANAAANAVANAVDNATETAILNATYNATRNATYNATDNATYNAVYNAVYNATRNAAANAAANAVANATRNATLNATANAVANAVDNAVANATEAAEAGAISACFELAGMFGVNCAARWQQSYQGGAYWAGYDCYLTAMRDIIGLRLPEHEKYAAWERCSIAAPFRVLHKEFCIVSDFPDVLLVDDQNRPHCENGPSHRWRDGWALYHWHGVSIPAEWIEDKKNLTAKTALTWPNIEQRRAACEIIGWNRILSELKARVIDEDDDPQVGTLVEVSLPDAGNERFLRVVCGTGRKFALPVPRTVKSAVEAQAWTWGLDTSEFQKPEIRT